MEATTWVPYTEPEPDVTESVDVWQEVRALIQNADDWMRARNVNLGGRRPIDVIGTEDEKHLRSMLFRIRHGLWS